MNQSVLKRLLDALQSARYVSDFTEGSDLDSYRQDPKLRSAVERQLEIVGEALSRARVEDPRLDSLIPDLAEIIGLRHRLAHGYGQIDDAVIWSIVEEEVPELIQTLESVWQSYGDVP
jgi:uncharacterized protein with HEPN domain